MSHIHYTSDLVHIHWVARQNKLEIPNDEEEVNTREIHKCDGRFFGPYTVVVYYKSRKRELPYYEKNGLEKK